MTIFLTEGENPGNFTSKHWVSSSLPDGKEFLSISGIVLQEVKGTGEHWFRERVQFSIKLPPGFLPDTNKAFHIQSWMPFVTLNAINNDGRAMNAGWAVDNFGCLNGGKKTYEYVVLWADVAVRDIDGKLLRIGYTVTLIGQFVSRT